MPNDNMLMISRALLQDLFDDVSDYACSREFRAKEKAWRDDLLARVRSLLTAYPGTPEIVAAHLGQPEPSASAGVVAAARAVIEADRAQTLTTEHVNALDNAIKIRRDELTLPEPHAEVTDAIAAVKTVLEANAVYFGRDKLQQIVDAARTGASS